MKWSTSMRDENTPHKKYSMKYDNGLNEGSAIKTCNHVKKPIVACEKLSEMAAAS